MFDEYFLANYLYGLNVVGAIVAVAILISSIDDLFIDGYYWIRQAYRKLFVMPRHAPLRLEQLLEKEEKWLAIMVPAWKEYDVVAQMVETNTAGLEYDRYVIFVGTYQNDAETTAEADRMVRRYPQRVHRATVPHDGPTCKSDCLNWIVTSINSYEKEHGIEFAGMAMHDCEDVIHPLELHLFNYLIDRKDLIQAPIFSLEREWNEFVGSTYLDDFSEWHEKEMVVRESLTGIVPGSGVATCYSRRAMYLLTKDGKEPFNVTTLTEDYDLSHRLYKLGTSQIFVKFPVVYKTTRKDFFTRREVEVEVESLIATREYFPATFRAAYRQRARWLLGVAFQGWQQLGWSGSLIDKYFFFRDRKSVVTSFVTLLAYFLVINLLTLAVLRWAGLDYIRFPEVTQPGSVIFTIYMINFWFFANRLFQRLFFVTKLYGVEEGLLSIIRFPLGNIINLFSLARAWRIFIIHLITGKEIAWDKTQHVYPISEQKLETYRKKIGEILVEWHTLTEKQLDHTLELQEKTGKKLGALLVELSFISDDNLADAISEQSGLRRSSLEIEDVKTFASELPEHIIKKYRVVPFAIGEAGTLNLAVASEPDEAMMDEISQHSRRTPAYFIVREAEIEAALSGQALDQTTHRRLGDVLIEMDAISAADLTEKLVDYKPEADGLIGGYMVKQGLITDDQLLEALHRQSIYAESIESD